MPATATLKTRGIQGESLQAVTDRLINTIAVREGVVQLDDDSFKVFQDTGSNLQVKVGSGVAFDRAVVEGDNAGQGTFVVEHQDASVTLALAAADPTNPRVDIAVLRVYDDTFDSSGNDYSDIEIITGVPAASPSAPATPSSAIKLAEIEVAASATAVTNANITDSRTSARGGVALPGGLLGYAEVTSNVGSITTTEVTIASTTITLPANRRIKLTGGWRSWSSTVAGDRARLELFATSIRMMQVHKNPDAGTEQLGGSMVASFDSGAGGSIACTLRAIRHSGTGTLTVVAGADHPAFILVEDLGPAL